MFKKGYKQSPEHIAKRLASPNMMRGHKKRYETRMRISMSLRGRHTSPDTEFKPGMVPHNVCAPDYTWIDPANGYRMVRSSFSLNGWRREHTVIAERALGRKLKAGEEVHHINGNKQDNRNSNLLVCSPAYHRMLERRMAYLYQREHFA